MDLAWAAFGLGCVTWVFFWIFSIAFVDDKTSKRDPGKVGWVALGLLVVSVGLTVLWTWIWRPFFHEIWMGIFYTNPGLWFGWLMAIPAAIVFCILVACIAGILSKNENTVLGVGIGSVIAFLFIAVIGWGATYGALVNGWQRSEIYDSVVYNEHSSELPHVTSVAYLPPDVAWRYSDNRLQESAVKVGEARPIVSGDEIFWQVARKPKGFWNQQKGNSDGYGIIDSTGNVPWFRDEIKYGEGMIASDDLMWKLHEKRLWSRIAEIYYVQGADGEVVAVAPYLDYDFKFPRMVMVPHWGGTFLVRSSGEIEDLKPEEAMNHPLLQGVRVFPREMAKRYVEAYKTKNGLGNYYFRHIDQIDIPNVSPLYRGHKMPYFLLTEEGQKWFVAAVPWGSSGSHRLFFIDARRGEIDVYTLGADTGFIGQNKARGYVFKAYPQIEQHNMYALYPSPVVREGVLYWKFTITPGDFSGVVDTVLVNSLTTEVISLGDEEETLQQFIAGEDVGRVISIRDTFHTLPVEEDSTIK